MGEVVYVLCALTSAACAVLLGRGYRASRTRLLLWSTLCFAGLALNNAILVADKVLLPQHDLSLLRAGAAVVAMLLLAIGLISEAR